MRYSISLLVLAAPLASFAAPARLLSRAAIDVVVFKFADVLEQLESQFYAAGIAKFQAADFTDAGFTSTDLIAQQLVQIQGDEATHSKVIQATLKSLGEEPITNCKFNFDSALTDVATMAATARAVEAVGVSAYLGGATLLTDPVLLDAAGSILSVEARHSTVLNILSGTGTAVAQAFDVPLTPQEVIAIASAFISDCDLGITGNPSLAITNTGTVAPGTALTFSSAAINGSTDGFHCNMMVGGATFSISLPIDECVVPDGINGNVFIWITSDDQPLANNVRDRATNKVIAGPAIALIDTQPETLGQLVRGTGVASSNQSSTTSTITPEEASKIIAGAQSTGTATSSAAESTGTTVAAGNSASSSGPAGNTVNLETGPSQDGKINVEGWSNLPAKK